MKQINIKFEDSDYERLEKLAERKRLHVPSYVRMITIESQEFKG